MIEVSRYQKDQYDNLVALHESQDAAYVPDPNILPEIGFTGNESAIIVAMGFLRKMEGGYGMIDTLVSNGDLPSEIRHLGIQSVVESIIQAAKQQKLHGLICFSVDSGIISRAKSIGFKATDCSALTLALGD